MRCSDVTERLKAEILFVDFSKGGIDLARKDAFVAECTQCLMKSP